MVRVEGPRLERWSWVRTLCGGEGFVTGWVGAGGEDVGGVGRLKNVDMDVCGVFCFLVIGVVMDGGLRVSGDE